MTQPATNARGWREFVPSLTWLPSYKPSWLRWDLLAALTAWAVIVPQAIAYAQIAGVEPQFGLAAAAAGLIAYAFLGTSRQLMVSPTSSTAALSAALVGVMAAGDAVRYASISSALAITCGVIFVVLGLAKLGFVSRFIPTPVQVGFMFGLGLTIIVGQLPKILGLPGVSGTFFEQLAQLLPTLGATNALSLVLGVLAVVALFVGSRYLPAVPMALIVVVTSIVAVSAFSLASHGVAVLGPVQGGFPLPAVPAIQPGDLMALLPGAFAILVISSAEALTVAERFSDKHGYLIKPDQELIGAGGANLAAGMFQGMVVAGGASQSAAGERAGAKTLLCSLIVGVLVVVTSVALLPLFQNLPQAVLGAIVVAAVIGFLRVDELLRIGAFRGTGLIVGLIALIGVLLLGILPGLIVAVLASILMVLLRIARPGVPVLGRPVGKETFISLERDPDAPQLPGLLVVRVDAPMLFLNAALVRDTVRALVSGASPPPRVVVLELAMSPDIDIESVDTIAALGRWLDSRGSRLWLADVRGKVREMFDRSKLDPSIRVFESLPSAVATYELERNSR